MKYLAVKDKKKRNFFKKLEIQIVYIKYCLRKKGISTQQRIFFTTKLKKLGSKGSSTKIRNRCVFSGKPRSVNRHFKMSRIALREVLALGLVPGFKKAVW